MAASPIICSARGNQKRRGRDLSGARLPYKASAPHCMLRQQESSFFFSLPPDGSIHPFLFSRSSSIARPFSFSCIIGGCCTGPLNYLSAYTDLAEMWYLWSWKRDTNWWSQLSMHVLVVQGTRWTTLRWCTRPGLISRSPHPWMSAKLASTTQGW